MSLNVNALDSNFDSVLNLVEKYKPHIIAITESWLTDSMRDKTISIKGYKILRNDRGLINVDTGKDVKGGGVMCYIWHSLYPYDIVKSKIHNLLEVEYICFKVDLSVISHYFLAMFTDLLKVINLMIFSKK